MKTLLHYASQNQQLYFPEGYRVRGVLQPLGEIEPGVWHLEEVIATPPEITSTQRRQKLPGARDGNEWRVGWQVIDIPQPHPAVAALEASHANGITVGQITLAAADHDRAAFSQLLVMLTEAERFESLPSETTITDASGVIHTLPTATVRGLLLQYGVAYATLWGAAAAANAPTP